MTDPRDVDRLLAEREYLRQRIGEVEQKLGQQLVEVNRAFGSDLTPARITPAAIDRLRQEAVESLRSAGNPALAEKWLVALGAWEACERRLGEMREQDRLGIKTATVAELQDAQ